MAVTDVSENVTEFQGESWPYHSYPLLDTRLHRNGNRVCPLARATVGILHDTGHTAVGSGFRSNRARRD